jgi:hypothetical protein
VVVVAVSVAVLPVVKEAWPKRKLRLEEQKNSQEKDLRETSLDICRREKYVTCQEDARSMLSWQN